MQRTEHARRVRGLKQAAKKAGTPLRQFMRSVASVRIARLYPEHVRAAQRWCQNKGIPL